MKKNNKGFAISTVIYGLSIMGVLLVAILMATMSANRTNTSKLARSIEEELNRISRTETSFPALNDTSGNNFPLAQTYVVPEGQSGFYRIELWGAQGGETGGLGAYTSGIIYLKEGQILYFYVGRKGGGSSSGRATSVRITSGAYNDVTSYATTIMAAAGGGANAGAHGGTLYGYSSTMTPQGGAIATSGSSGGYDIMSGTLIGLPSSYAKTPVVSTNSSVIVGPNGTNGGGDGYYSSNNANYGGTSYISGYGGVDSLKTSGGRVASARDKSAYNHQTAYYDDATGNISYEGNNIYYFLDGFMQAGVNTGDGKAKIDRVSTKSNKSQLKKNPAFYNKIKKIVDCVGNVDENPGKLVKKVRFSVISSGVDLGGFESPTSPPSQSTTIVSGLTITERCYTYTLSTAADVDEITIWHVDSTATTEREYMPPLHTLDGYDYLYHRVTITDNTGATYKIKDTIVKPDPKDYPIDELVSRKSETETVNGFRFSAYQTNETNRTKNIPEGDYYIMPVTAPGKVFTAPVSNEEISNPVKLESLMGYRRQKWSIQLVDSANHTYKIIEQARYKALTIDGDENLEKNKVKAERPFNNYTIDETQVWKITPAGDGTYYISASQASPLHNLDYNTGNLACQTNPSLSGYGDIFIGINNISTERYRLISLDYAK